LFTIDCIGKKSGKNVNMGHYYTDCINKAIPGRIVATTLAEGPVGEEATDRKES
jgi:hypothetical protein